MDIRDGTKEHLNITKMSDEGKQREGSDGQKEPMEAEILWGDEQPGDRWVILTVFQNIYKTKISMNTSILKTYMTNNFTKMCHW